MKKATFLSLSIVLAILLAAAVLMTFWAVSEGAFMDLCPFGSACPIRSRHGAGGRMGPWMMRHAGVTIDSEYEYLIHMIPHHEEAVYTAGILKENTDREEMRNFAEDIIRTQSEEIELMTTWLAAWYPDRDHQIDYQPMMRNLEYLQGEELDLAFLQDMIIHHMEAVMMSQQLISRGLAEHEEVELLARKIRNNQRNEIHMMRNWLSGW